ncbi:MAG: hypothetical protein JWN04_3028 [Myxococcaceae bacterium]|nr:hypothetical protein [Myxococcaceae bacterium]
MRGRLLLVATFAVSLLALPADATPECNAKANEWELELTRVECEAGDADLQAIVTALGTRAIFRGGFRDPAHSKTPPRAVLVGSTDGAGLNVGLEKSEP